MKKILSFFLGASLFMVNVAAQAQSIYYTTSGIPESSTLTLRTWPSHTSQSLANIPHNTNQIVPTGQNIVLDEKNWLQVSFADKVGWVEEVYVSKLATTPEVQTPQLEQAQVFAMPEPETELPAQAEPLAQQQMTQQPVVYQEYNNTPQQPAVPWSASADSIYQDPNATSAPVAQPEVFTTTHSVAVIPSNTAEEIDLRNEGVTHSRYSSVDTSISLQYEQ